MKADTQPAGRVAELYGTIRTALGQVIVGQDAVVEQVLTALLCEGHVLIVGVPGLAKTLLVSTLARILGLSFSRIQFTPDLMPSDITGTTVVAEDTATGHRAFRFMPGPVFANIILADEINRTPPKTQAALMEAMEERHVTQGRTQRALERPFFVLATQNPIEQEGTYPLPVSQLDRFLFTILIDYPTTDEEYAIMNRTTTTYTGDVVPLLDASRMCATIDEVTSIHVPEKVFARANCLVRDTRPDTPSACPLVKEYVSWGAGPRATQALIAAARARAALHGRGAPTPADVDAVTLPALRHRLVLSHHAQAEGVSADSIITEVLRPAS